MSTYIDKVEGITCQLRALRVIPVLVVEDIDEGMQLCSILNDAGLKTAEITFRTAVAEEVIRRASSEFEDMIIGAGTILNKKDLHRAFNAGAKFAVAPGFNPTVVTEAVKCGFPFMPGISSPTQLEQAMELGIKTFKFFPAEAAGGIPMLKSMIAPYRHLGVGFVPTGGIKTGNMGDYLALPEVIAVGGTWLGKSADKSWDDVENCVKDTMNILSVETL